MRINWKSPFAKAVLTMLCLGFFVVVWPTVANIALDSLPGARPTDDDMASIFTVFAMIFVGLLLGIHAGTMINERTLWLRSKAKRTAFLLISGAFAACITYVDSTGGVPDQRGPANYVLTYFFAVQALPLLWFLYNLHGEAWLKALARQRNRKAS